MKRWIWIGIALIVVTVLVLFNGCGRTINRAAERRIRDALPQLLGPARQYRVHIDSTPTHTLGGHLTNVTIDGDDIQLANGLLIDHLHLDLNDVDVDTGHNRIRHIGSARFIATISEATLDEYLAGESPKGETLRHTRVTLGANNRVTLSAERVVLGVGVPFRVTGPLRIANPQRIELDPTHLTVVGIPFSGLPLRFLTQRFESAIDLSTLPFPVQLTGVQTVPSQLTLSGNVDTNALLQRIQAGQRQKK